MANLNIDNKSTGKNEILYHINLSRELIKDAKIAILPGDNKRVSVLAKQLDTNAYHLTSNREYTSYLANVANQKILIISTGMGGPSAAIAVEELAMIGVRKFIRVGTCGAIQENINIGDIILTTASVRLDGTSYHYAPTEYPAVASFTLNNQLYKSAMALDQELHCGITASSDTFYPGQERKGNFSGYIRKKFQNSVEQWRKLNVLNLEMESSAILTVCATFGLDASCICTVLAKRTDSETVDKSKYDQSMQNIMSIIKKAIENGI